MSDKKKINITKERADRWASQTARIIPADESSKNGRREPRDKQDRK